MSNKMKQVEAVYVSTMNVLAEHNIAFDDGMNIESVMTKEIRDEILSVIVNGFETDQIELSAEAKAKYFSTDKLKVYTRGLMNNWFRKDKRLNGGTKYEAKNPGSRAGAGDEQLKALKLLRQIKTDDAEAVAAIDQAIANRLAEIKPATKHVELTEEQLDQLPANLRSQLGI